jgi:HEAT repeat protein
MSVTMEIVKSLMSGVEPDERLASTLGPDALPHLEALVREGDQPLAARAVYFASFIKDPRAVALVANAALSPSMEIRVQAAMGARRLPRESIAGVLAPLFGDPDVGIRVDAVKTVKIVFSREELPSEIKDRLSLLAASDPEPFLRELSKSALP